MCKIIAITNRHLCSSKNTGSRANNASDTLIARIKFLISCKVDKIILREKDMAVSEYVSLARKAIRLCEGTETECILHSFNEAAFALAYKKIHLPLKLLYDLPAGQLKSCSVLGASLHTIQEIEALKKHINNIYKNEAALPAQEIYITASHIFKTKCKENLEPKGLEFLKKMCQSSDWEVYALGGINKANWKEALEAGADGVCFMSEAMCAKEEDFIRLCSEIHQNRQKP